MIELLLQLLDATFFDLILAELFEIVGETELLPDPDGPFCWIVLPPFDRVAVVGWKLVVEVMVSLAEGYEGGYDVVSWGIAIIEGLFADPMGKGIHTKGGLLNEENAEDSSVHESTKPITPA